MAALALDMDTLPEWPVTEALKAFLVSSTEQFNEALKGITSADTQHLIAHAASEGPIAKDRAFEVVVQRVVSLGRDAIRKQAEGLLADIGRADKNKDWDELRRLQKLKIQLDRQRDWLPNA